MINFWNTCVDTSSNDLNAKVAKELSIKKGSIFDRIHQIDQEILIKERELNSLKFEKKQKEKELNDLRLLDEISVDDQFNELIYFIKKLAKQGMSMWCYSELLYDINKQKLEKLGYRIKEVKTDDYKKLYAIYW
ncbi:hypothetical protein M0Q97_08805 [Candidatus Dojkabacteria bacterium]|jgi:hypothetical protein|nr:hypothetical protein [Candidatus Dojkabacteria bacterium]